MDTGFGYSTMKVCEYGKMKKFQDTGAMWIPQLIKFYSVFELMLFTNNMFL